MEDAKTVLKLTNVDKVYGKGEAAVQAIKDVSLKVWPKEVTLIMGPSGSGKTTLLSISGALLKPTNGSVFIDDTDISRLSETKLPAIRLKNIGFVFQAFNLLSALTVLENVEFAYNLLGVKGRRAKERATDILTELGLRQRLNHYPDQISGGEKQRVALARALVAEPKLILADEPTGNLDSKSGYQVVELLHEIANQRNSAVVIASHDTRIMNISKRILWLEDGTLKESGIEMVTDPICEMRLRKDEVLYKSFYKGIEYYFCSEKEKKNFDKNPKKYIKT